MPEEYVKVSFQIEVTNTCDGSKDVYIRVEMLDSDGFLVESTWTITTVRPGPDTVRFNGSFIHPSVPDQVARFDVTVEPWEF